MPKRQGYGYSHTAYNRYPNEWRQLCWAHLQRNLRAIEERRGEEGAWPKARALSEDLMRLWDGLWVFVTVEGVEPTNNAAEQALRPAVLWRKGSFGTQREAGSRFVERILTVQETCRRQGRSLRAFVMEAVAAHRAGRPAPKLVPTP